MMNRAFQCFTRSRQPSGSKIRFQVQMVTEVYLRKGAIYTHKTDQVVIDRCAHAGCQGTLTKGCRKGMYVSAGHLGCVRLACVTLLEKKA